MANYYTYGETPDPKEAVYGPLSQGFADGGEVDEDRFYVPREDFVPIMPEGGYPEDIPYQETAPTAPALSSFDAGQKLMALTSLIDPTLLKGFGVGDAAFGGAGTSGAAVPDYFRAVAPGTVGGQGALYEEGALEAAKKAAVDPTQGLYKSGFEALAGQPGIEEAIKAKSERDLGALAKVESDYEVMKPISDLLKANKFEQAFDVAKEKGVVDKMMTPGWLEQLRQPFTEQEMKAFYKAIPPDYRGSEFSFNPDAAQVSASGYPEPLSAFQSKDKLTAIDAIIRLGGAAVLGAGALSALGGAGAASGAGAAGGAGGAGGLGSVGNAIKAGYQAVAGIPAKIGGAVANALGLPIQSTVAQTAFGNALVSSATTAAKGGDIGDIIKSGLMAAGVTYGLNSAVNAVKGMMPDISQAVGNEVANVATTTGVSPATALDALQEVVVTAKKVSDVAGLGGAAIGATRGISEAKAPEPKAEDLEEVTVTGTRTPVAGGPAGALATTKPEVKPEVKAPLAEEAPPEELEEVKVTAKRPEVPPVVVPPPPSTPTRGLEAVEPEPIEQPAPEDLEEVKVTARRPEVPPVVVSPPPSPPPSPIETVTPEPVEDLEEVKVTARRPEVPPVVVPPPAGPTRGLEVTEPEPVEDLEEVKVTGRRVEQPPVVVSPPPAVKTGSIDVTPPEEPLEEVKVTGRRELDFTEPPPIVVKTPDIAKDYKPTEVKPPEKSELQKLLEKYGTLENLLKVLGAIGAAGSKTPAAPVTTPTMPSLGGALPKYTYTRQQLSPDIDYYTYGTRPEAKFFEQGLQLEKPVQPPAPPAGIVNPKEEPVFAAGGLTGYARGGSKSSRYVDGPGSGREDKIPALLSDGEYVIDAETLALLGDGSTKEGARRMDRFRANIRKHKGQALSRGQISPNAKSPEKYMGGGLT